MGSVDYSLKDCYYPIVTEPSQVWHVRLWKGTQRVFRWLRPGLGVKRWLVLILAGVTLLGVGLAIFLLDLYRTSSTNTIWLTILSYVSLRFLARSLRVLVFGGLGVGLVVLGIWGLNRTILKPFLRPGRHVIDQLDDYRRRERGPHVVAIGGGHGLSTLLRGLKEYTHNLTAVVSVADDGGSSGELRRTMGILPPGDIRNCLAALSNDEALLTQLFQYRFSGAPGLNGHSFGNLFISALSDLTGSFEEAVAESGRVLSVYGRVLPSTLHNVRLIADVRLPYLPNEVRVEGESRIPKIAGTVRRVWLDPNDAPAFPPVIQAILSADLIVIGPGSLYTSILPNLLVRDLLAAIYSSRAVKAYIVNIATQSGETDDYSCGDHVRALDEHIGEGLLDLIVCNNCYEGALSTSSNWAKLDEKMLTDARVYCNDLVDREHPWHHDSARLAQTLINLLYERTGPLSG